MQTPWQLAAPSRRDFLKTSSLVMGGAALSAALPVRLLAQDASDIEKITQIRNQITSAGVKLVPVAGNVSMITGAGGNIGVITGPEGKVLIDAGVSTTAPDVLKALAQIDAQPLKYLLNTHWHFDHTEGNEALHKAGATIVAHVKTRDRLAVSTYMEVVKIHFPASPPAALPTRTLTDSFTFYMGGDEITLQHVPPAHTDTDLYVVAKNANVIHAGDLFFNGTYPLIDYSTGGNVNGFLAGIEKVLAVADNNTKIIPGHGPLASKADFKTAHDMLATIRDRVAAAKQSGKSLEEVVAAKPSAEFDAKWGKGMIGADGIVSLIYKTL
jgi:glyoxylase-like metal-dependent hydrolase (beta-lactamase superfamily II)